MNNFNKAFLTLSALVLLASTSILSADKGDKVERYLDRKADRARDAGKDGLAYRPERKGDIADRRLDRKGHRYNKNH